MKIIETKPILALRQWYRRATGRCALIYTTKGYLPTSDLLRKDGGVDNENENTTWTEYYLGDELVRRDVHVRLKKMPPLFAAQESLPQ
jgi:hypothetical protein